MNLDHGHEQGNSEYPTRCIDCQADTCTLVEVRHDTAQAVHGGFRQSDRWGPAGPDFVVGGKPWHGGIAGLAEPIKADARRLSLCLLATFWLVVTWWRRLGVWIQTHPRLSR
jgi:hypothetical protein